MPAAVAEDIGRVGSLPAPLVEAFASVPRERFLGPGPWVVWGEGQSAPQTTIDADPARVYVNASIAIDADRQLFNGLPSFLGRAIARWRSSRPSRTFDAILVNAGVTHLVPLELTQRAA